MSHSLLEKNKNKTKTTRRPLRRNAFPLEKKVWNVSCSLFQVLLADTWPRNTYTSGLLQDHQLIPQTKQTLPRSFPNTVVGSRSDTRVGRSVSPKILNWISLMYLGTQMAMLERIQDSRTIWGSVGSRLNNPDTLEDERLFFILTLVRSWRRQGNVVLLPTTTTTTTTSSIANILTESMEGGNVVFKHSSYLIFHKASPKRNDRHVFRSTQDLIEWNNRMVF